MKEPIPDEMIHENLNLWLSRMESKGRDHVTATIRGGNVTLSGTLSYEHQRRVVLNGVRSIEGVRRVIDHLRIIAPKPSNPKPTRRAYGTRE